MFGLASLAGMLMRGGASLAGSVGMSRIAGGLRGGADWLGKQTSHEQSPQRGEDPGGDPFARLRRPVNPLPGTAFFGQPLAKASQTGEFNGGGQGGGNWDTVRVANLYADVLHLSDKSAANTPPPAPTSAPPPPLQTAQRLPIGQELKPSQIPTPQASGGWLGAIGKVTGFVGALVGATAAVKGLGEASLASSYEKARFDPRIAAAYAKDQRQNAQLNVQSGRATGGSTAGLAAAMRGLRDDLQPISDAVTNLYQNGLSVVVTLIRSFTYPMKIIAQAATHWLWIKENQQIDANNPNVQQLNNPVAQWVRDLRDGPEPRQKPPRPPGGGPAPKKGKGKGP